MARKTKSKAIANKRHRTDVTPKVCKEVINLWEAREDKYNPLNGKNKIYIGIATQLNMSDTTVKRIVMAMEESKSNDPKEVYEHYVPIMRKESGIKKTGSKAKGAGLVSSKLPVNNKTKRPKYIIAKKNCGILIPIENARTLGMAWDNILMKNTRLDESNGIMEIDPLFQLMKDEMERFININGKSGLIEIKPSYFSQEEIVPGKQYEIITEEIDIELEDERSLKEIAFYNY